MGYRLTFSPQEQGVAFTLTSDEFWASPKTIAIEQWSTHASQVKNGAIGVLLHLHEEHSGSEQVGGVILRHETIASLCQSEAFLLGLPPITPLHLSMQSHGNISQSEFRIETAWLTPQGLRALGAIRTGSMLRYQGQWQRLPQTLYDICEAIDFHNGLASEQQDERRKYLACITDALPEDAQKQICKDGFLSSLRVYHAAALSLHLTTHAGEFDFLPVLFGLHTQERTYVEEGIDEVNTAGITEGESLLPTNYQENFIRHFTRTYPVTRPSYVLGDNRYVFLEPMLQDALEVVRTMRQADTDTQREFIRTPQRFFKEVLAEKYDEAALEAMFVATQEYSERVVGLSLWVRKALPWVYRSSNSWIPESYGVMVDDKVMLIADTTTAAQNMDVVRQAMEEGKETVTIAGTLPDSLPAMLDGKPSEQSSFTDCLEVNVTQDTVDTLESIKRLLEAQEGSTNLPAKDDLLPDVTCFPKATPIFLNTADNLEAPSYCKFRPRKPVPLELGMPVELKTTLKPHQIEAWHWLARMWSAGYSGALLADDMGLGKTLACLTFLAWLRQRRHELVHKTLPVLILAPTSLVGNWQDEAAVHLHAPGLGNCTVARGTALKNLRLAQHTQGRDIDDGSSRLDATLLQQADWILTTYETLRDYHHSFASVPLSVVVFDEMQKAKNCTSQISCAIRTLNAEFYVGLTGTPIENSLADMWSIMDVLLPGFLGELRQFNSQYAHADEAQLRELKAQLEGNSQQDFRPMLRRMKTDTLQGLPSRHEHVYKNNMPAIQAHAYENAMCNRGDPLRLLQALRMVSLHPLKPHNADDEDYATASARFVQTLDVLDAIQKKKEKALLFLESREHQPVLAVLLQERYALPRLPRIINGQTPAVQRQQYVKEFQAERNHFDVIILSPKAAGVGLTLTAANHVIHLSRWWNPAVEDQCTDRAYRLGQERDVHVYFPLAVHPQPHLSACSFDLQLHCLLEKKRNLSRDILLPPQSGEEAKDLYDMVTSSLE